MRSLLLILIAILLSACQSAGNTSIDMGFDNSPAMNDLALYALSLEGTPYKYGGNSPDTGFDCSGFVNFVFKQTLGKTLPRTSDGMSHMGRKQHLEDLKPGDLVFYNTGNKSNSHVGIYLGEGRFVHSPATGKSVSIANMNETYWRERYNGARRINP